MLHEEMVENGTEVVCDVGVRVQLRRSPLTPCILGWVMHTQRCTHQMCTHIHIILAHAHTHNTQRSSEGNPNRQSLSALLSGPVVGSILAVGPLKRLPRGAHQVLPQRSGSLTPLNYPRPLREGDNLCRKK